MKTSKSVYAIAIVISIVFYLSGLFTGVFFQKSTLQITEEKLNEVQRRLENVQLEYTYLNVMGNTLGCNFLGVLEQQTSNYLYLIRKELADFENKNDKTQDFLDLKKDYTLASARAWLLNSYIGQQCGRNDVVILYLYSVPCDLCVEQGKIIDDIRAELSNTSLNVFVLDVNIGEPIVNVIKDAYNVSTTPYLVIGNSTYRGLVEKQELIKIISG